MIQHQQRRIMSNISVLLVLVCALLMPMTAAFAADISIYEHTDTFTGNTLYFTKQEKPKIEGGSFISERYVYINFIALSPMTDPSAAYGIKVEANIPDWMFIAAGKTLALKLDGKLVSLYGAGSMENREVVYDGVQEIAYYSFSLETLRQLAAAQTIEFRVSGDKNQITGIFTDRMMQELRLFSQDAPGLIAANTPAKGVPENASVPGNVTSPQLPLKLGASFVALPPSLAGSMKLEPGHGLLLIGIVPELPAAKGGLKVGDVMTSFDGVQTDKPETLQSLVAAHTKGMPAVVTIVTAGQPQKSVSLSL